MKGKQLEEDAVPKTKMRSLSNDSMKFEAEVFSKVRSSILVKESY